MKMHFFSAIICFVLLLSLIFSFNVVASAKQNPTTSTSAHKVLKNNAPKTVSGFKCSTLTSSQIKLNWNKVSGANGYFIYRYNYSANKWVRTNNVKGTTATFTKLTPATRYAFAVKAYKTQKGKVIASPSYPKLILITRLNSASILKAQPFHHIIKLSWNKLSAAQGYIIYKYNTEQKHWERFNILNSNTTDITLSALESNTVYYFALRGYKIVAGREILSENIVTCTTKTLSSSVKNLKIFAAENRIRLSWDKFENATGYNIYLYNSSTNQWDFLAKTAANNYVKTSLQSGKIFKFGVVPIINETAPDEDDIATVEGITLPGLVRFDIEQNDNNIKLSWVKRAEADGYIVYTKLPGSDWNKAQETDLTTCTIPALDAEEYLVAVRAVKNYNGEVIYGNLHQECIFKTYSGSLYSDGDSIAYGTGSSGYSYSALFAQNHALKLKNNAVGGGTLASETAGVYHIAESVIQNVNPSYDIIFLEGGINDYYRSAPLGEIKEDENEFDINTTCGALQIMLSYVKENCPDSKVYFISVHKTLGADKANKLGLSYEDYKARIDEICKKYNISVIDCYNSDFDLSLTTTRNSVYPDGDGIHPTLQGYIKYYLPLIEQSVILPAD